MTTPTLQDLLSYARRNVRSLQYRSEVQLESDEPFVRHQAEHNIRCAEGLVRLAEQAIEAKAKEIAA